MPDATEDEVAATAVARPVRSTAGGAAETPHVVIVGAGFGGLEATTRLARSGVRITLIDRSNHHLFQPLLYQVATATLSPSEIAWPIRRLVRRFKNVTVIMDEVTGIDRSVQRVTTTRDRYDYDALVLATGAHHSYFGHDDWQRTAPGLKGIADATRIRRRLLLAFERAEVEHDEVRRRRELTFAVVGGGPTGVELAGALAELARKTLPEDYRHVDPSTARVVLIEAGRRILPTYDERLSAYAANALDGLGVEVRTGAMVTDCATGGVTLNGTELLPAATVLWAAGVQVLALGDWLGVPTDRAGRISVTTRLTLTDDERVFVIGDAAHVVDGAGRLVPGIAPAAKQQGRYVATRITDWLRRRETPPFVYRDRGQLATIGRHAAVVDFGWIRLTGRSAWWLWGLAHIYFLIGNRSRLFVALSWLWGYLFNAKGARLIVDVSEDPDAAVTADHGLGQAQR